jgi:hypothetical protein
MRNKIERNLTEPPFVVLRTSFNRFKVVGQCTTLMPVSSNGPDRLLADRREYPTAEGAAGKLCVLWRYLASDPLEEGVGQAPGVMYSK